MIFLKIAVFIVAGVVFLGLIRKNSSAFVIFAEITIIAVVLTIIVPEIENLLLLFDNFESVSSIGESTLKIMFKSFGILAVGSVVIDICRDNGENAVAGVVEMVIKILAVSCALPVFSAVIEIALTFF